MHIGFQIFGKNRYVLLFFLNKKIVSVPVTYEVGAGETLTLPDVQDVEPQHTVTLQHRFHIMTACVCSMLRYFILHIDLYPFIPRPQSVFVI